MNKPSNHEFWLGLLSLDTSHHPGALFGRSDIHQYFRPNQISQDIEAQFPSPLAGHFLTSFDIGTILIDSAHHAKLADAESTVHRTGFVGAGKW